MICTPCKMGEHYRCGPLRLYRCECDTCAQCEEDALRDKLAQDKENEHD